MIGTVKTRRIRLIRPSIQEMVLIALLVGLWGMAEQLSPQFLSTRAQVALSSHVWELALLALPMTLIILTAGIDLSVGSTMALSAVVFGLCFKMHWPLAAGVTLALLVGAAAGAMNGVFIAYVKVHPLIVTLATLAAYRGIAEGISLGRPVSGFPEVFTQLSQGSLGPFPMPAVIFGIAILTTGMIMTSTPVGLWLSAIGYNETAAEYSGIAVRRIKVLLYTASGLMSALAGLLFVARRNTAKADIGTGMELAVITAVVLGGSSIFGGRGRLFGALLGILLIHEVREFLSWQWSRDEITLIVVGVLLILAVLTDSLMSPKKR